MGPSGPDELAHLELWLPDPSLGVAQEGDERGAQGVLLIVVLGAVAVRQLDQTVVVGQVGVGLAETPRPPGTEEERKRRFKAEGLQRDSIISELGACSSYWAAVPPAFSSWHAPALSGQLEALTGPQTLMR